MSLITLSACLQNSQLRTEYVVGNCLWEEIDCDKSMIEQYPEYDLTFIEFTERGNLYDRESSQKILDYINGFANHDDGVAVFVFVHGWKTNAQPDSDNILHFKQFLSRAAENEIVGQKKVIGLYLGWRGDVTKVPLARDLTYWGRKAVAEEIGSGAVTEVFSQLHQILVDQFDDPSDKNPLYKNNYVIIGHSFGGAIVLSALHDVMLKDLVAANPLITKESGQCEKINRYADALVLINPAIEANKVILLKEAAARCNFDNDQSTLMHVLSSNADNATKIYFPIGQITNLATPAPPKTLKRTVNGKEIVLDEGKLNTVTVGNLKQIRTGSLSYNKQKKDWEYVNCRNDLEGCGVKTKKQQANHFPTNENDPLSFIETDKTFIKDHNDAFGCYVQSYITSIMFQTQSIDRGYRTESSNTFIKPKSEMIAGCNFLDFDFSQCFNNQLEDYDCPEP